MPTTKTGKILGTVILRKEQQQQKKSTAVQETSCQLHVTVYAECHSHQLESWVTATCIQLHLIATHGKMKITTICSLKHIITMQLSVHLANNSDIFVTKTRTKTQHFFQTKISLAHLVGNGSLTTF